VEKQAERWIKIWMYMRDEKLISAIDSKPYAKRFFRFLKKEVFVDQKAGES
jgi:hypothetical protein